MSVTNLVMERKIKNWLPTSLQEKGGCSTVLIEEEAREWKHNCEELCLGQQTGKT